MNLSKMKIITRIMLGFLIVLGLSISTVGFLLYELKRAENIMEELYNTSIVSNNSLEAEINIYNFEKILDDYIVAIKNRDIDKAYVIIAGRTVALESSLKGIWRSPENGLRTKRGKGCCLTLRHYLFYGKKIMKS